jgi:hypothetical protein
MSSTPRLLCSSHKFNTDHLEKISGLVNEKISGLTKEGTEVGVLAEWFDLHRTVESLKADAAGKAPRPHAVASPAQDKKKSGGGRALAGE